MPGLLRQPHRRRHRRGLRHRPRDRARLCPRGRAASPCSTSTARRRARRRSRSPTPAARRRPSRSTSPTATPAAPWPPKVAAKVGQRLDPGQQCRHQPAQRLHGRSRRRAQGLAGHHGDQPQRRVQRDARLPRAAARQQGAHRQYRLDPVLHACAHAELARLHHLEARRARLHPRARRRARQGRRARQRHRPGLHRDAAQRSRCAPTIRSW